MGGTLPPGIYALVVRGNDLVAGTGAGVYLSSDNGVTWIARKNGLAPGAARTVAVQGNTFVTAIYDVTNLDGVGEFISADSGLTWSSFSGGIGQNAVRSLAISGNTVYAGTETQSIWTAPLGTTTQNSLSVAGQVVTRTASGASATATDTVTVKDQSGAAVSGVTVTATYSGPNSGTATGVTNRTGVAKLKSAKARNPVGKWCFTVTGLAKTGYVYDPNGNVVTTVRELKALAKEQRPPSYALGWTSRW